MNAPPAAQNGLSELADLKFITKNSETGKKNIFVVRLLSLDNAYKWQFVGDSSGNMYLYSDIVHRKLL
ncbi:MAG: hypothetical protein WA160_12285 [Pseudobdellovibrio sp.]